MSLKTKIILGVGVFAAIGIGIGLELHRLHRRIRIRKQGCSKTHWSKFASKG